MTVKTVKGSGGDYTTIQAALNACPADITAGGTNQTWEIEVYASAGAQDSISIPSITTDAQHFVRIYAPASERHQGKASGGTKARILSDFFADGILVTNGGLYLTVEGMEFVCGNNPEGGIRVTTAGQMNLTVIQCFFGSGPWVYPVVYIDGPLGGTIIVANNILSTDTQGDFFKSNSGASYTAYLYNNTAYTNITSGFGGVITQGVGTLVCKNNIVHVGSGTYSCYSGTISGNNNVASDSTAPGTSATNNATPTFINAAGGDLHLSLSDTVAKGNGADLHSDANYAFSIDIDYDTRSAPWDIGADQTVTPDTLLGQIIL